MKMAMQKVLVLGAALLLETVAFAATDRVELKSSEGTAVVALKGARVESLVLGGREVLFRPAVESRAPGMWTHGGMPVCWPWFGSSGPDPKVKHGFAWKHCFEVREQDESHVVLGWTAPAGAVAEFPSAFDLEVKFTLTEALRVEIRTTNAGADEMSFTVGTHPYLAVGDRDRAVVTRTDGLPYCDTRVNRDMSKSWQGDLCVTTAYDHAFAEVGKAPYHELVDASLGRKIGISSVGASKLVVWNPGPVKIKGLADDDWRKFVCVEPVVCWQECAIRLAPGKTHVYSLELTTKPEESEGPLAVARKEFSKYVRMITDKEPPAARFAVDPSLDATYDEYRIVSEGEGVAFLGGNRRAVLYAVYDFLERRGDCRWYWDQDIVPKKETLDCSGLDVREKSAYEYRGMRYFAHRGLTRFQAEHWGYEDWKKELDYLCKRRMNFFMPRIGQDDLFQLAYPDAVAYPDPSVRLPGTLTDHRNRSLFWSLEYRHELRRKIYAYADERDMIHPEDYGTMTHWYSLTPKSFLEKYDPPFLPKIGDGYKDPTGLVWDTREQKWRDAYVHLTETALKHYGDTKFLHTIGLGERMCYKDRAKNLQMKIDTMDWLLKAAKDRRPDSKVFVAGWDFYRTWFPAEVREQVARFDPNQVIVLDYEADATRNYQEEAEAQQSDFRHWNLIGKFPYTFGIFLCFEDGNDIRANYPVIFERQKCVQGDPFCKGYVVWPEASHTDSLFHDFFARASWKGDVTSVDPVLDDYCAHRYGAQAEALKAIWCDVVPIGATRGFGGTYENGLMDTVEFPIGNASKWTNAIPAKLRGVPSVFRRLADVDWTGDAIRRDTIDLARTTADRFIAASWKDLMRSYYAWKRGEELPGCVKRKAGAFARLGELMADVLALHTDFSVYESYLRLDAVEKIRNPGFDRILLENTAGIYCRSHQYELARHWYAPVMRDLANAIAAKVDAVDRESSLEFVGGIGDGLMNDRHLRPDIRNRMRTEPLATWKPTLPRTPENFRKTMLGLAAASEDALEEGVGTVKIAHFRKAITPEVGAPLGGYYADQRSVAKHDDLFMTGLCVDDGRDKVLIVAFDLLGMDAGFVTRLRNACAAALGIPAANVLLTCSHTHEGPETARRINCPDRYNAEYCRQLEDWLVTEVKGLASGGKWTRCHVCSNAIKVDANYNRRYVTSDVGGSFMTHRREIRPLCDGPADKELGLLLFYRVEGRETPDQPEYVIGNYAAHPLLAHAPGRGGIRISADFPGVFRDYLREETGAEAMFIQGAAGDLLPQGDELGFAAAKAFGERLGMAAIDAMIDAQRTMKRFVEETPRVGASMSEFVSPLRVPYRDLGRETFGWTDGRAHLDLQCVSIGDTAFVGIPGELATELGFEIKWHSVFRRTWIAELSTGYSGYISHGHALIEGGYEPKKQIFHSRNSLKMVAQFVDMLGELRGRTFPVDALRDDPYPDCMEKPVVNIPEGIKLRNFKLK